VKRILAVLLLLAGTNDIAGNTGPMTLEMTEANIASMTELAQASGAYDGVHPTEQGYDLMLPVLEAAQQRSAAAR